MLDFIIDIFSLNINVVSALIFVLAFAICFFIAANLMIQGKVRIGNLARVFGKKKKNVPSSSKNLSPPRTPRSTPKKSKTVDADSSKYISLYFDSFRSSVRLTAYTTYLYRANLSRYSLESCF